MIREVPDTFVSLIKSLSLGDIQSFLSYAFGLASNGKSKLLTTTMSAPTQHPN